LAGRLIQSINIAGLNWNRDGFDFYEDPDLFCLNDMDCFVFFLSVDEKQNVVTKETLAWRLGICLDTAMRTIKLTTQRGIWMFLHPTDWPVSTHKSLFGIPNSAWLEMVHYDTIMFVKVCLLCLKTLLQM
jgi:hypothetical protein